MAPEASGDYLELFDALWEAVASVEREWVLFKPQGFRPTLGFAGEVKRAMQREPRSSNSSQCEARSVAFPPTSGLPTPKICAERSASRAIPACCWRAGRGSCSSPGGRRTCLSYWTWILLVQALSEGVAGVVATPVVLRDKTPAITNICSEYASWAKHNGERQVELPYPDIQWRRLSIDVFASVAERLPVQAAAAFAWMASDPMATGNGSDDH